MVKSTSATDNFQSYKDICENAVIHDEIFNTFRRMSSYTCIVDNLPKKYGPSYIKKIKEYISNQTFLEFTDQFRFNEIIGSPKLYDYGEDGCWSPVTLRYIKTLLMLEELFGSLDGLDIAEIGGGYGGQSAIIQSYFKIPTYYIFDLNEVVGLINKYLENCYKHTLDSVTINQDQLQKMNHIEPDVVISDYAFSELSLVTQETYFEKVIKYSKFGHMTLNFMRKHHNDKWSLQQYIDKFESIGKRVTIVRDEILAPKKNCIFIWGNNEN